MSKVLHEYRDKNNDLFRVRQSSSGEVYMDSYTGDERNPIDHIRDTSKISSGNGIITGHGKNHAPHQYGK